MSELIAVDPASKATRELAARVADTDATVLLCGESGVGKEVYARFIHTHSSRDSAPFVAINCAAIPENMLEAMLFGYEKGAFTGATTTHAGKFEQANGGTLLLDEISEMDIGLQAKLLRVLQEREIERLGGRGTVKLNVRVIATTNRDLRAAVRNGDFREDLFYRLNVFPLFIPPLRERPLDILPLSAHFLERNEGVRDGAQVLSAGALDKLNQYPWPGNVRELDNVMQRALILRQNATLGVDDIHFEQDMGWGTASVLAGDGTCDPGISDEGADDGELDDFLRHQERRRIDDALRQGRSKKEAAEILGISPRTLRYKLARLRDQGVLAG